MEIVCKLTCYIWSGMIIGFSTKYYQSNSHSSILKLADSTKYGLPSNIIKGLALCCVSVIITNLCLIAILTYSLSIARIFFFLTAVGMLEILPVAVSIPKFIHYCTNALDAGCNTTDVAGKRFAIGSAELIRLSLFKTIESCIEGRVVDIL
jgi:Na+/H+-translocating membrane pyrophosphatase